MVGGAISLMSLPIQAMSTETISPEIALDIEPFDVEQTLDGGQAFGWHESASGVYRGVLKDRVVSIRCDDRSVSLRVEGGGDPESMLHCVEDYLVASSDVDRFKSTLAHEPGYGEDIWEFPLIRVLRQDPWECLAAFICSQNSNIPRIKQMVAAVTRMGHRIGPDDWAFEFPEPAVVGDAGEAKLRAIGLGYRAKHLAPTAAMLTNSRDLRDLRNAAYGDAKDALMELPGVGPKVADCVLAYSLDKGEAFPVDVHVRRAAIRLYGLDENVKNDSVGEWARDRFGEYAAWAQLYMFRDEINRRTNGG